MTRLIQQLVCPSDITQNVDSGLATAVVTYVAPVGTDNCGIATTVQIAGLASGIAFPVGTTTNTFEVTDAAGNTSTCSFDVIVVDSEAPVINCISDITQDTDSSVCEAVVTYVAPVGTDNSAGSSYGTNSRTSIRSNIPNWNNNKYLCGDGCVWTNSYM